MADDLNALMQQIAAGVRTPPNAGTTSTEAAAAARPPAPRAPVPFGELEQAMGVKPSGAQTGVFQPVDITKGLGRYIDSGYAAAGPTERAGVYGQPQPWQTDQLKQAINNFADKDSYAGEKARRIMGATGDQSIDSDSRRIAQQVYGNPEAYAKDAPRFPSPAVRDPGVRGAGFDINGPSSEWSPPGRDLTAPRAPGTGFTMGGGGPTSRLPAVIPPEPGPIPRPSAWDDLKTVGRGLGDKVGGAYDAVASHPFFDNPLMRTLGRGAGILTAADMAASGYQGIKQGAEASNQRMDDAYHRGGDSYLSPEYMKQLGIETLGQTLEGVKAMPFIGGVARAAEGVANSINGPVALTPEQQQAQKAAQDWFAGRQRALGAGDGLRPGENVRVVGSNNAPAVTPEQTAQIRQELRLPDPTRPAAQQSQNPTAQFANMSPQEIWEFSKKAAIESGVNNPGVLMNQIFEHAMQSWNDARKQPVYDAQAANYRRAAEPRPLKPAELIQQDQRQALQQLMNTEAYLNSPQAQGDADGRARAEARRKMLQGWLAQMEQSLRAKGTEMDFSGLTLRNQLNPSEP